MIRRLFFELRYLLGNVPWDTGVTPPELQAYLDSHPPGRALDLGCGTGTNSLAMAERGWQVVAVDFSARAIRAAKRRGRRSGLPVQFLRGDVTELRGVQGPFDLALDIGCFHSLKPAGRARYAARLAELLRPQGDFLLYCFLSEGEDSRWPGESEIHSLFQANFEIVSTQRGTDRGERISVWFTLKRKP